MVGLLNKVINVFYPPRCIFCRQVLSLDCEINICSRCNEELPYAKKEFLQTGEEDEENFCDGAISVFRYKGIVKDSLIRFKFYSSPSYYRTFARLMAERFLEMAPAGDYDMIVSVPLHKQKEYARGYNQSRLISKALSREIKLPEKSKVIKRLKNTGSQSLLDKKDRRENIKGAFAIADADLVRNKSIILVDDIMTTGATLEECGRVLKEAGAKKVTALVVATGRKY